MRTLFTILLFLLWQSSWSQTVKLMTYNIRLDVAVDGDNAWPNRKYFLLSQLQYEEPDILGTQEGLPQQVRFLKEELDDYQMIGQGRDGVDKGEYSAIFYKKDRFQLEDSGTFWLSETPDKISKGWDAAINRICTYVLLKDKRSGMSLWVFNTHFDHVGEISRQKAAALILNKSQALNTQKFPVIVMGDLNVTPDSKVVELLNHKMRDSYNSARINYGPDGTFNGFNYNDKNTRRIDYIFTSKEAEVNKYAVLNISKNLRFPSDHFPVIIEMSLKNK